MCRFESLRMAIGGRSLSLPSLEAIVILDLAKPC